MGWFRSLYNNFPVVRGLQQIKKSFKTIEKASQSQLDAYVDGLLQKGYFLHPKNLNRHERRVFSQGGEDGILAEIFRRIREEAKVFVEIGVGNGLENNTTYLLLNGWKGIWIEANKSSIKFIKRHFHNPICESRLTLVQFFVTKDNISSLLHDLAVPQRPDLLSMDIDRNTYWITESLLQVIQPRVVVVEYNGIFPPSTDWKVEYVANRPWNGTLHFGASLKAYEKMMGRFNYCLVGCNLSGVNAFFVRKDLCEDKFQDPFTSENHYQPYRPFLLIPPALAPAFSDD